MSSAIVMFVMCLHHSSSCSQELHLSDSPWIGLQVSAVVRGATRCDVPFTTSSSPPSKSSQGVTIQPQEVALGYAHEGEIEHGNCKTNLQSVQHKLTQWLQIKLRSSSSLTAPQSSTGPASRSYHYTVRYNTAQRQEKKYRSQRS